MSDIFIKLEYPIARPEDFGVKTNAKSEVVADLLADFLHAQIGAEQINGLRAITTFTKSLCCWTYPMIVGGFRVTPTTTA